MPSSRAGDKPGSADQLTISSSQAILVSLGFNVSTIFVIIAREVTEQAGVASYLVVPAGYLIALLPVLAIFQFNRRFPGMRFGQYSQVILGRVLGKGLAAVFALTATVSTAILLQRDSGLIAEALMPETPLPFFMMLQLLLALYILIHGFEVYARLCQVLFIAVGVSVAFLFLASFTFIDLENFLPVVGLGLDQWAKGALPVVAFSAQYAMLAAALVAHMRSPKRAIKVGMVGWLGSGLLLSLAVVAIQGVFGAEQAVKFVNPPLELAKIIQLGGVARGVEAVLVAAWMVAGLFQVAGFYYLAAVTLHDTFGKPGYRLWLAILYVVILAGALLIKDPDELVLVARFVRFRVLIPVAFGSYVLLAVVAWVRGLLRNPAGRREGEG